MVKKSQAPTTRRLNPKSPLKTPVKRLNNPTPIAAPPSNPVTTKIDEFVLAAKELGFLAIIGATALGAMIAVYTSDPKLPAKPVPTQIETIEKADVPVYEKGIEWPVTEEVKKTLAPEITLPEVKPEVVVKTVEVQPTKKIVKLKKIEKKPLKKIVKLKPKLKKRYVDLDTNQITMNNLLGIPNY